MKVKYYEPFGQIPEVKLMRKMFFFVGFLPVTSGAPAVSVKGCIGGKDYD